MNTAEQIEPRLTERIKEEQDKLRLMCQRSNEA